MIFNYVIHNAIGSILTAYFTFLNGFKEPYISCVIIAVIMFAMALNEVCVMVVVCNMSNGKFRNPYLSSMTLSGYCYHLWFGVVA